MLFFKCICIALVLFALFLFAESAGQKNNNTPSKIPVKEQLRCPFCGNMSAKFYVPADEPKPVLFQCSECLRYYGYTDRMSPEEKRLVMESDRAAQYALSMPELSNIINTVVSFFKSYRKGSPEFPMVMIRDGKVTVPGSGSPTPRLIATYPASSRIGDQQICMQCFRQLKGQMPYLTFKLGDGFVSMEIYK